MQGLLPHAYVPCRASPPAASLTAVPALPRSIFDRLRAVLHEGMIDKRVQFIIEGLTQIRRRKFEEFPAVKPELDLVESGEEVFGELRMPCPGCCSRRASTGLVGTGGTAGWWLGYDVCVVRGQSSWKQRGLTGLKNSDCAGHCHKYISAK